MPKAALARPLPTCQTRKKGRLNFLYPPGKLQEVERQIQSIPEFTECDKITGEDCFVARLHVRSMEQLDELLDRINVYAETNTAIVKKTSVPRRLPPMN